ncbi:MAG: Ig-like domain-containing protein [Allosphingosinicella sp.]
MAVNLTATRTTSLFTDNDGDGVIDTGDIVLTRIRITNIGSTEATGISVTDTLSGVTLVGGSVQVTPIAYDDAFGLTGNTPITITAAQGLLVNDVDPDGAGGNAGLVVSSVDTAGTQGSVAFSGDGSFTFTPTTGFVGVTSFKYFVSDAQGLHNVTEGIVTMTVTDKVWYVDASYAGANGASDGSYLKPFASLASLNNNAADSDGDGDTIFVYNSGPQNVGITLENNEKLFGDGHAFMVNNINIGANASNTTINHSGAAIIVGTGNTIDGFDLVGNATGAVGIADNNGTVGTLTVTGTNITGQGQILDVDQGGTLAVTLGNVASTGSTGASGGVIDVTGVGGALTVTGTTTINGTHSQSGIDISGNNGLTAAFQGNVTVNNGANIAINIGSNTGTNAVTFSGGLKDIDTTSGTALNFTGNTTSTTVSFTGTGGLDVDTTSGTGLNMDNTTLVVSGAVNTVNTATGAVLAIANSAIGAGNVSFDTLGASGTVAAGAGISINNLDNGTFSGGNVTIVGTAGATADGLNIQGGSSSTFNFASATIGGGAAGTNPITGDAIELNGANGAVTFTTVNLQGSALNGVNIVGATNAVTISGGTIGTTNDPGGDGVNVTNGTGAVTVAAAITKTTGGNEVVDISGHNTGAISFSGALNSSSGGGGIRLVNNTGGTIGFTNSAVNLNTGTLAGVTFTNTAGTGAAVSFTGGNLNIDTTSGTGINATNTTTTAGSLTISGSNNSVVATTGRAIGIDGVASTVTLHDVAASGGATTAVYLNNAGSGGFTVTGTGTTAGTGGTIGNITGADGSNTAGVGVYIGNTSNVSLSNMQFSGPFNNFAIKGSNVVNFTLRDSVISDPTMSIGNNTGFDEGAIRFDNLSGVGLFEGNKISGAFEDVLSIENNAGTLNMFVRDTAANQAVFGLNNTTNGNDVILVETSGDSNLNMSVVGVDFTGWRGDAIQTNALGTSNHEITITNNNFLNAHTNRSSGGGIGVIVGGTGGGASWSVDYNVSNNLFKGSEGYAMAASFVGTSGKIRGFINNNTIGTPSGGGAADATQANTGSNGGAAGGMFINVEKDFGSSGILEHYVTVSNNTIRDVIGKAGMYFRATNGGAAAANAVIMEATITNNTIDELGGNGFAAIRGLAGGNDPDAAKLGMNMSGNTFNADTFNANSAYGAVMLDEIFGTNALFTLPGYNGNDFQGENYGTGNASTDVMNYLTGVKGNTLVNAPSPLGFPGVSVYALDAKLSAANFTQAAPTGSDVQLPSGAILLGTGPVVNDPSPLPPADPTTDPVQTPGQGGESKEPDVGPDAPPAAATPPPAVVDDGVLTQSELSSLVDAAIQRWIDAGASPEQVAVMRSVKVGLVDMAGIYVGSAETGTINIDTDGAGKGWFVDSTPGDDSEYSGSGTSLAAIPGGAAGGKIDLLTVLMHELGHQIGLSDDYNRNDASDLMYGYVNIGERRLPHHGESTGAVPGSVDHEAFALSPVLIAGLPANKTVDIFFKSIVNAQTDNFITNLAGKAIISRAGNPDIEANETVVLDSLTLGSTVFKDVNLNGHFDAGEGIVGVALQLYADTNDSGGWDAGDALLGSTTTVANGAYSFAGLAPGDYIVVVTAANFNSGQPLNQLLIVPGVAADPDDNVDNDNNGVAATGGAVASQTITLDYNTEPTAATGNDTNNTLDFGFVVNQPPVANADSVSVAEDSGANDLTSQLLTNDTDPDGDTKTIASATQGAHGSTSVVSGVLTYTPVANYNGSDTFDYTINDGHGHTATATVTVTVTAVSDPVTGTAPASVSLNEDATNVAIAGMSISDVDATLAPAGVYEVTLSSTHGTLTLTTLTGLTFTAGSDGTADASMTFHGTLAAINTALATAKYTPDANYNGAAQIDLQVTDTFGGTVATGTGSATADTDSITVTVNSVNDEPVGANQDSNATEGVVYTFSAADFSDGMTDPNDNPANAFNGVRITTLPGAGAGTIKLNGVAISAGAVITKTQLDNNELTFTPASGSGATNPTFTFQVRDDGTTANGGVDLDQSANTYTIHIAQADAAPVLDLDGDDSSAVGTGYASSYVEGGAAAAIADTDLSITDGDAGDDIVSAVITITNSETGDKLNVGGLPAGITVDASSTDTMVKLVGIAGTTADDMELAIKAVTYSSTSDDPTDQGTNMSRSITVVVNDGILDSNTATATVSVTDVNDAPTGTDSTITATEDSFRVLSAADLGFHDVDGTLKSVTISAVTGGKIYFDSDGAGGADPVEATLPHTYTAADLAAGLVSFKAAQDANGAGLGTITFTVTDNDDADSASSNTLTVDVTAVNDSPDIDGVGQPVQGTEQTAIAILAGKGVADVDLDARNGGNGDYAGSSFSIARNLAANPEDSFSLLPGADFTIDGNDLKAGGQIFGTITTNSGGQLVIAFTSLETTATSALVDEVIAAVQYTNGSDNPPSSVSLAYSFNDGGGQGTGGSLTDDQIVSVLIDGVNDAPSATASDVNATEQVPVSLKGAITVDDVDANSGLVSVDVTVDAGGTIDADPGTSGVTFTLVSGGLRFKGTLAQLNDFFTANATSTLTFTSSGDTPLASIPLNISVNDNNNSGAAVAPGLVTDVSSTIFITAVDDAAVAKNDDVSTPENAIGMGYLFIDNNHGPDSDPEGDPFQVTGVQGGTVGVPFALASGAILTVNADGSYSYDPNHKFDKLTDNTSGAVNTSQVGDTFTYTVTGGSTATVIVTVNGVAGPGDWLMGDSGDNTITGTPQADLFVVNQGGADSVYGLAGEDIFYFGGALTPADVVDGGANMDTVLLQGDYSGGLVLDANITNIEAISFLAGSNTSFGESGSNRYSYDVTTADANFAGGQQVRVNGSALLATENLTFNGSAETDANFVIYGGRGTDTLTGGSGNDIFFFAGSPRFAAGDTVNGGAGYDSLFLRGNYTIDFNAGGFAGAITNMENITVSSASDERYARGGGTEFDYNIKFADAMLGAGGTITINGALLTAEESLSFDGSLESNGQFRIFAGGGNDVIIGGAGNDLILGGGRGDTLTGGAGNDTFRYDSVTDSNSTERDGIQDFTLGDIIDLSKIDSNSTLAGNQAFDFIGSAAFGNHAGELRFENISLGGPIWLVQGDTDGNGISDFEVVLVVTDANPITSSDFIL